MDSNMAVKTEATKLAPEPAANESDVAPGTMLDSHHSLHRRLNNRQIQLIALGASIGTGLFISISSGLADGGPGSLFIGFVVYCLLVACVNNCMAEMGTYQPVSGGFVRMAGKWVDDSLGFMAGWNYFLYNALLIPFEITAINALLSFWRDDIPAAAIICVCIVLYGILNTCAVQAFGEAEFWLSSGKVILIFLLFSFTLVTMCGGNSDGDAYGFRYWSNPGAFAEYTANGSYGNLARFEGFLSTIWTASFIVVGPEYLSMVAGEAQHPRVYMKNAFKTAYLRFGVFYILSALCVGIVVPYNEAALSSSGASRSPYIIAMRNLGVRFLPDLTAALMITSIFSAGNAFTYASTRSLYALALEGRAPRFLSYCTKNGVPIWSLCVVMCFPLLSFLQLSESSSRVLDILVGLITGGCLVNFIVIGVTYIFFYHACKAQGFDRKTLPYYGYLQPYCSYVVVGGESLVLIFYGYSSVATWNLEGFWIYYTMFFLAIVLFLGWKAIHRTRFVRPSEADLVWESPMVDAYEASSTNPTMRFWGEMLDLIKFRRAHKVTSVEE